MNVVFGDDALSELYETGKTKKQKYKYLTRNAKLVRAFQRVVTIMYDVESVDMLKFFSFLHYEKLRYQGTRVKSSIRLMNGRIERLIFTETTDGIEVELIEIDTTHYGNK